MKSKWRTDRTTQTGLDFIKKKKHKYRKTRTLSAYFFHGNQQSIAEKSKRLIATNIGSKVNRWENDYSKLRLTPFSFFLPDHKDSNYQALSSIAKQNNYPKNQIFLTGLWPGNQFFFLLFTLTRIKSSGRSPAARVFILFPPLPTTINCHTSWPMVAPSTHSYPTFP